MFLKISTHFIYIVSSIIDIDLYLLVYSLLYFSSTNLLRPREGYQIYHIRNKETGKRHKSFVTLRYEFVANDL
jgi:hypothetical protein